MLDSRCACISRERDIRNRIQPKFLATRLHALRARLRLPARTEMEFENFALAAATFHDWRQPRATCSSTHQTCAAQVGPPRNDVPWKRASRSVSARAAENE